MSLADILGFSSRKSEAERAHDEANDAMAMQYNEAEEIDLQLHAKSDHAFRKYTVTTLRSLKDWREDFARMQNRIYILIIVMLFLELLHKDGASSLIWQAVAAFAKAA